MLSEIMVEAAAVCLHIPTATTLHSGTLGFNDGTAAFNKCLCSKKLHQSLQPANEGHFNAQKQWNTVINFVADSFLII